MTLAAPRLASLCGALAGIAAFALTASPGASGVSPGAANATARSAVTSSAASAHHQPAPSVHQSALQRRTGLTVTIDDITPVALTKGQPLAVTGRVSNDGTTHWRDAQVYLEIGPSPATTRADLDIFAAQNAIYGTRLIKLDLFDQIGPVHPGETKSYQLSVPFHRLPIDQTPGAYHVGVSVLAQNEDGRDLEPDAQVDTLVPLLPTGQDSGLRPTSVVTLVPLTAPVLRQNTGNFLDDELAPQLAVGGRLRNVLDVARHAPRSSLQVIVDPALLDAVRAMATGYVVQTLAEAIDGAPGRPGIGQHQAAAWQHELEAVARRQQVSLLMWGTPDASALATNDLPGVVKSAVTAARSYATRKSLDDSIVGWQPGGFSNRRGLSVMARSGTSVQVVTESSLLRLPVSNSGYPPSTVTVPTAIGPLRSVVTRHDVAGQLLTAATPALELRQRMLAEATVRSLLDPPARRVVFALPVDWNPGRAGRTVDFTAAFRSSVVRPTTLAVAAGWVPAPYSGPVDVPARLSSYPSEVLAATARLRDIGRVFTGILTAGARATDLLNQRLGVAGSAAWRTKPHVATALIRRQATAFADSVAKVTVTGPTFVALSSTSGRFPITVTNGLNVPITVRVAIRALNPALHVDSLDNVQLAAGQRKDVPVVSRADGSGLTQVRLRLATPDHRRFGTPWSFDVRTTQFGVVIWVAMGAGAAVLFGAAGLRIYRRVRDSRSSDAAAPATR